MRKPNLIGISCVLLFIFSNVVAQQQRIHTDTLAAREWLEKGEDALRNEIYQQALDATERAQELYTQHELWEAVVQCATDLAAFADNFNDPEIKINYAQNALHLALLHLPKEHRLVASAYRQKAEALMLTEALDSSNYFLQLALPIFEETQDWVNLGWSEILLSVNYLNQSQLAACDQQLQKVETLLKQSLIPDDVKPDMQSTLLYLSGIVYESQGDIDRSIKNTLEALTIDLNKAQLSSLDSSFISAHYNNLGTSYILKGNYQQAYDYFIQAMDSYWEAQFDTDLLNNIGSLLYRQGKYQEAINYYQKSLEISRGIKARLKAQVNSLIGLSLSYRELNFEEKTLSFCQQIIDAPTGYRKFMGWSILGNTVIKRKQVSKAAQAIDYIDRAINTYTKDTTAFIYDPFILPTLFWVKGNAFFLKREPKTALSYYQQALITNHTSFKDSLNYVSNPSLSGVLQPIYFLEAMRAKAKTLATLPNQKEAALNTYQLTIQWIDSLQANYATEAAQLDWSGEFKPIYEEALEIAYQRYQSSQNIKYLDLAFYFSEKSKNAILLETLKSKKSQLLAGVPDSVLQKEKTLNLDIAFYEKSWQKARAKKESDKEKMYQQYLAKTRLELVALKEQLARDYPKYQEWKTKGQATSIAEVQAKLLDEETTLLEYFVGDSSAFVFVINKNSAVLLPLASPAQIQQMSADFRQLLSDPSVFKHNAETALAEYTQNAFGLYQYILQSPMETIPTATQRLIIVPDGVLNAIPFEALCKTSPELASIDFAELPYVLYDYQLQYAYSANLLLKNQSRHEELVTNTACLALAPAYQDTFSIAQRGSLEQLRSTTGQLDGTAKEIQEIAHFIKGQFDFGESATEQQFKIQAPQFGLLHLAMHGVLDMDNANFNHLKFSDLSADSGDDNLLHHYEIANMDLTAQLVVLSACETGLGKYEKGEGVYSLARSFMYAGVPSVVMSLWKVSDVSTSQLMPYFYESLMKGASKGMALQVAKRRFLKEADVEFRHPFYWSAFVVMGDEQSLKQERSGIIWWGMGALLLLSLLGGIWKKWN